MNHALAFPILCAISGVLIIPGFIMIVIQSRMDARDRRDSTIYGGLFLTVSGLVVFFIGTLTLSAIASR
jgi:hypothetical protein